jgi:hypothetical protein
MARWLVQLEGERLDLEEFQPKFPDGELYAIENEKGVYLTGPEFERLKGAEDVRNHAFVAVDEMSAVISLLWPAFHKPSVGNVYRESDEGGLSTYMTPVAGELRIKEAADSMHAEGATATPRKAAVAGSESPPEQPPPTDAQHLLRASRATSHLRTAVLLWAVPNAAWWLLYRIVEDIETHLNELGLGASVSKAGYCSEKERVRFRRSANSAEVSGLGAGTPPANRSHRRTLCRFRKQRVSSGASWSKPCATIGSSEVIVGARLSFPKCAAADRLRSHVLAARPHAPHGDVDAMAEVAAREATAAVLTRWVERRGMDRATRLTQIHS